MEQGQYRKELGRESDMGCLVTGVEGVRHGVLEVLDGE